MMPKRFFIVIILCILILLSAGCRRRVELPPVTVAPPAPEPQTIEEITPTAISGESQPEELEPPPLEERQAPIAAECPSVDTIKALCSGPDKITIKINSPGIAGLGNLLESCRYGQETSSGYPLNLLSILVVNASDAAAAQNAFDTTAFQPFNKDEEDEIIARNEIGNESWRTPDHLAVRAGARLLNISIPSYLPEEACRPEDLLSIARTLLP